MTRPVLAVDWDGTLVDTPTQEWLPGAQDALRALLKSGYTILIHTCRANYTAGLKMVEEKLVDGGFEGWLLSGDMQVWQGKGKPDAAVYIDNLALSFECWADLVPEIRRRLR